MSRAARRSASVTCGAAFFLAGTTFAQETPPTAGYPAEPSASGSEPAAPAPSAQPAPSPPPPAQSEPAPPASPPPATGRPQYGYFTPARDPNAPPPQVEEPPAPPAPEEHHGFTMPPWSVRIDPFTWLIQGRLGLELEVGVLKWLSVEMVPVFVTGTTPPALGGFSGRDGGVSQHSNGLGPISGTSIGAGFWLSGNVLHGYVLRAIFTNYGYEYRTDVDSFVHTDRVLEGMIGSNATWGPFTIGGGIGLGVDLNSQTRCINGDKCNDLQIRLGDGSTGIVSSFIYPVVLDGRISLGVTFD